MLASALTIIAAVYLSACLVALGARKPGYRHVRHTISELGEVGAPHQRFVAVGVFLPVGLLLLPVAWLAGLATPTGMLAVCIAVGYLVGAAFPCDVGSPFSGTGRQFIHNLGGGVEYVGGGIALMRIGQTMGQAFELAGYFVLASAVALSLAPLAAVRGLIQRIAELCFFAGLAFAV